MFSGAIKVGWWWLTVAWVVISSATLFSADPDTASQTTGEGTGDRASQVVPAESDDPPASEAEPTETAPLARAERQQPPPPAVESSPEADREVVRAESNLEPEHPNGEPEIDASEHVLPKDMADHALPNQKVSPGQARTGQTSRASRQTPNGALAPNPPQSARGPSQRPPRTRTNVSERRSSRTASTNHMSKPSSGATGPDFSQFKIITDRNIFNASRSARQTRVREDNRKPAQTDSFTLVGTMSYENRIYAFFDGSSPEYKKVIEPGKKIAGYTVKEIGGNGVKLEKDGQTVDLQVGGQMRRGDEGWSLVASVALAPERNSSSATSSAAGPSDESDVIKKLMAQRERELQSSK